MLFKEKVTRTITRNALPGKDTPILIVLSGGADSVALLRVMLSLGYTCEAAHCNFHLRGKESERDEAFVRVLCEKFHIKLHVANFDTKEYAAGHKISVEMAARELRYAFFDRLITNRKPEFVAVAHHRDDNAETLLLNLLRGTGLRGLCGMQYLNGKIIRPLLDVSRKEITDFLASLGQTYVTDSTNLQADIMRNKIRLEVLPLLRGINPSVDSTLHREAGRLRETMSVYKWGIDNILKTIKGHADGDEELAIRDIPDGVSHEAVLYEWLYPRGFNETQVLDIMEASSNDSKVRFESCEYLLILEQGVLYLANKNFFPGLEPSLLPDEGETNLWNGRKLSVVTQSPDIPFEELKSPCNAFLDAGKLKLPLKVRAIRNGDRFVPFGMKGSKLVSDYLADRKVPWLERMRQLVVTDNEKIVWLVGQRVDDRVKVTPETKETICLRMR